MWVGTNGLSSHGLPVHAEHGMTEYVGMRESKGVARPHCKMTDVMNSSMLSMCSQVELADARPADAFRLLSTLCV